MIVARRIFLIITLAVIVVALQSRVPAVADTRQAGREFSLVGLVLGMNLTEFKTAYPATQITVHQVARYCFGRRALLNQLNWASAVRSEGDASVQVTFHQIDNRFQITSLVRREALDVHTFDWRVVRDLRDRLTSLHGPYTRLLARRKMEPAGRIVGFEWSRPEAQNLSVVVHEDHADISGHIIVTTRLTSTLPGMRTARTITAHNREVIETFRQQCQLANR